MTDYEESSAIQDNHEYDVFISCKSEDYTLGYAIYEFLIENGVRAFFADQELRKLGFADYGKVIDNALDGVKHLIVVASNADFTKEKCSPYVYYEWKTFSEEKRSGRKTGNIMTVVTDKSIVKSLPIALRNVQSFVFDEYKQVYNYVIGDMPSDPKPSPFRRINNFVLNFRLGKNLGCVVSIVLFVFLGAVITPFFFLHESSDPSAPVLEQDNPSIEPHIRHKDGNRGPTVRSNVPTPPSGAVAESNNSVDLVPFIYFVKVMKIEIYDVPDDCSHVLDGGKWEYVFSDNAPTATGFITNDSVFVTARQVVEPWAYFASEDGEYNPFTIANIFYQCKAQIEVTLMAENETGDKLVMKSSDFKVFRHNDVTKTINEDFALQLANGCDFACKKVNFSSTLAANTQLSQNLEEGVHLELLGFPYFVGGDKNNVRPLYTYTTTSRTGLLHGVIPVNETGMLEMGNSGGPVFVKDGDYYYVVGIVTSSRFNKFSIVPISAVSF